VAKKESAMTQVIETVDVDVPVEQAYNQWTQFESFPQFLTFVKEVTQQDATHNHWTVNLAGVQREFDTVITEQHPDERVAWTSVDGKGQAGVVTFHKLGPSQTRVTVQLDWEPENFVEKIGDALGFDDRAIKKDLQNFKQFIESRPSETGAWRGDVSAG
jgi:uncharacterized membrane protein